MKWEYTGLSIEAKGVWNKKLDLTALPQLNELGEQGWELVSVSPVERTGAFTKEVATYAFGFIFKRPKE